MKFSNPAQIVDAKELSQVQKLSLLRQWEQDLRAQMTASREGMGPSSPNPVPELLREVRELLRNLEG